MTEFEKEVHAHLTEMVKRPLTDAERATLARALEERREAEALIAAASLAAGLTH